MKPAYSPGQQVRDATNDSVVTVLKVSLIREAGWDAFFVYSTDAPNDPDYPDGKRLESELRPLHFVGPILP